MTAAPQPTKPLLLADLELDRGFYYLASPYSKYPGGIDRAHLSACALAGALMKRGIPVYSPIAHSHPIAIAAKIDPFSHDFWLPVCLPTMQAARGAIIAEFPSWEQSKGMAWEIEWFEKQERPVARLSLAEIYDLVPEWSP